MNSMKPKLDEKIVTEIAGALDRIQVLTDKKIVEQGDAAERRGLELFVTNSLRTHAEELLGAWTAVRNQYGPLVRGFAALMMNASQLLTPPTAATPPSVATPATPPESAKPPQADKMGQP